jgi:hypothetical protein
MHRPRLEGVHASRICVASIQNSRMGNSREPISIIATGLKMDLHSGQYFQRGHTVVPRNKSSGTHQPLVKSLHVPQALIGRRLLPRSHAHNEDRKDASQKV